MSIKITATSTCDLPAELVKRHQITLVPLYVSYGGGTYRDGVDTGPEDIFRHVEEGGPLPSTSAVNIADYQALFAELSPEYDHVLHITIGSDFSCCYQNALVANLLKLKPCIVLADGKMTVGKKYRGAFDKVLADYVLDQLTGKDVNQDRIFVVHTRCDPAIPESVCAMVRQFGFHDVITAVAGSTISCHCGPNTLGIVFFRK